MSKNIDTLLDEPGLYEKALKIDPFLRCKTVEEVKDTLEQVRYWNVSTEVHQACEQVIQKAIETGNAEAVWKAAQADIGGKLPSYHAALLGRMVWVAVALGKASRLP